MIVLGITGGIATGKSTVTQMFADLGAPTASADAIARELLGPGTNATVDVANAFPTAVLSTQPVTIDRRALSALIFAETSARERLEAILHPPIVDELKRRIEEFRQLNSVTPPLEEAAGGRSAVAAVEIPLLFESGLTDIVDRVLVVAVDRETQLTRLQRRLNIDRAAAEQQLESQWPLDRKVEAANYVIDSGQLLDQVRDRVREIYESLR
jgi:dephospho-CoA kinase